MAQDGGSAVGVAKRAAGCDTVPHEALELGDLGEATLACTGPHSLAVEPYVENTTFAGYESDATEVVDEGREELLGHPGGAGQPVTLGAVFDLETRCAHQMAFFGIPHSPPERRRMRTPATDNTTMPAKIEP